MKKDRTNYFCKVAAAGMLSVTLVLSGICILPAAGHKAQAAKASQEANYWTEEVQDISGYTEGKRVAKKPTDEQHKDWLFAGWFTDQTCQTSYNGTSGRAVAKFVRPEVLSVKTQVLADTTLANPSSKLRIVSTVDSLNYAETGFDITINGNTRSFTSKNAFRRIVTNAGGIAVPYAPEDFSGDARFFTTGTLKNIPASAISEGILITPWWKTLDGTKVEGVSRYARVDDAYNSIYNVPIRLYDEKDVAAGYLEVSYDPNVFTYEDSCAGNVFEEMAATVAVKDGKNIVRCIGNVKNITSNKKADGMYINLRFKLLEGATVSSDTTFEVSGVQFYDNGETKKDTYVPAGFYKVIQSTNAVGNK